METPAVKIGTILYQRNSLDENCSWQSMWLTLINWDIVLDSCAAAEIFKCIFFSVLSDRTIRLHYTAVQDGFWQIFSNWQMKVKLSA